MLLLNREVVNRLLFPDTRKEELKRAQEILAASTEIDLQRVIEAWITVAEYHKLEMEPQLSEEAYLKALEAIRIVSDERLLGKGYKSLGDAMQFCKNYERAIASYRHAVDVFKSIDEIDLLLDTLSQIAYSYAAMGQWDNERHYLNMAVLQPAIQPVIKATLLERIALSLSVSGKQEEAIGAYEQALSLYESEGFKRGWQQRIQNLAEMYNAIGDTEAAKRTLERL